jgi:hypothetical protein
MFAFVSGGLDLLFSRQPLHKLRLPSQSSLSPKPADMRFLIDYLAKNVLKEREELFREGETMSVQTPPAFLAAAFFGHTS